MHVSAPVWKRDLPDYGGTLAVSFRDLMEIRFVDFFISHGVSWTTLREAARFAAGIVGSPHPFSTARFKTDGRRIFAEFTEARLLDVRAEQYAFPTVIDPYLYKGVVYESGNPARWFPIENRRVVIDPAIGFGQPTITPEGVSTAILSKAARVEKSVGLVARWYEVPVASVQAAIEYENQLAA
jgi:uncharacterized protein (DUF433 family)